MSSNNFHLTGGILALTNYFLNFRVLDLVIMFLIVWYYCTLTVRESILIVNGSRIKVSSDWMISGHVTLVLISDWSRVGGAHITLSPASWAESYSSGQTDPPTGTSGANIIAVIVKIFLART